LGSRGEVKNLKYMSLYLLSFAKWLVVFFMQCTPRATEDFTDFCVYVLTWIEYPHFFNEE